MISNASPLICLAKLNQLELLKKLFGKIIITTPVKDEVLIIDKEGFLTIEKAIQKGWIKVLDPKSEIYFKVGRGENSSINLAKEIRETLIIDDANAIKIAKSFNINFIRTTTILLMALEKSFIDKKQTKELLQKLVENGYYISSSIYVKLLGAVDKS